VLGRDSANESLDVIYRNGLKFRWDRYRNLDDVKVLKDDEFPPGIFDGEKLLEGAKVETY